MPQLEAMNRKRTVPVDTEMAILGRHILSRFNLSPGSHALCIGWGEQWAAEATHASGHSVTETPIESLDQYTEIDAVLINGWSAGTAPSRMLSLVRGCLKPDGLVLFADETGAQIVPSAEHGLLHSDKLIADAGMPFIQSIHAALDVFALESDSIRNFLEGVLGNRQSWRVASPSEKGIRRFCTPAVDPITFLEGCYSEERHSDGVRFRWCQPRCHMRLRPSTGATITVLNWLLARNSSQKIYIQHGPTVIASTELHGPDDRKPLRIRPRFGGEILRLTSNHAFSDSWTGGDDRRLLSYVIEGFDR